MPAEFEQPGSKLETEPSWFVWIDCPHPVVSVGLERILSEKARVYVGSDAPEEGPSFVVLCADEIEDLPEGVRRIGGLDPDAPVLVFGPRLDLPLAWAALKAGARGFIHAGMTPEQIVRAVTVVMGGELAAPRQLLEYALAAEEPKAGLGALSARQREVLGLVGDGLSNAEIARRLFLSESTVKQHLRAAYKALGVRNRTEAARLLHQSDATHRPRRSDPEGNLDYD